MVRLKKKSAATTTGSTIITGAGLDDQETTPSQPTNSIAVT